MIPLAQATQLKLPIPVLRLAFRPFFLLAALFALLAIGGWAAVFQGWAFNPYGGSYWWHAHEMLFGFVAAVIVGFLLTAVQNWTGVPGIKGNALLGLVILWLLARLLIATNITGLAEITALVDMAFLPAAAACLARSVLTVRQYRNLIFVPLLLGMTLSNLYMHLAVMLNEPAWVQTGSHAMVMLVTAIMCVIGGRVFPMFTANGTGTRKVPPLPWLEKLALISIGLLALVFLLPIGVPDTILTTLLLVAGIAHSIRWIRWRFWVTFGTPLVWSLHVAYACIPIGLLLMALNVSTGIISFSMAMHVITVGAMGGMILSMISRVSLGHTGRMITVGRWMTVSFLFMVLALLSRTLLVALWPGTVPILVSAIFWCLAFAMFLIQYFPILTQPRVDGAHG
ncbi:MAG: NnrS family protein [Ketobacteraceae bacterium]|nr:NnrS family protein [Ketobacteraceae bacterium]